MIFAGICAGGSGTRIGGEIPKQYLLLKGKPIISYSVEAFLKCEKIGKILIAVSRDRIDYCKALFPNEKIQVIEGGETRNQTMAILAKKALEIGTESDILITHDAARPFVTERAIKESAEGAKEYGGTTAAVPASDTVLQCEGGLLKFAPPREEMYLAQTPQAFKIGLFLSIWESLDEKEKNSATDLCGIFSKRNAPVKITEGDRCCFKITYKEDLERAEQYLNNM